MAFPIKPLLDRVIVREIPLKDYFEFDGLVKAEDLDNDNFKVLSDRGVVEAAADSVTSVKVGDTVMFDEFARGDQIFLNPAHRNKHDKPTYFQIRVPDLKGIVADAGTPCSGCVERVFGEHKCEQDEQPVYAAK